MRRHARWPFSRTGMRRDDARRQIMADGPAETRAEAAPEADAVPVPSPALPEPDVTLGGRFDRRLLLKGLGAGLAGAGLAPLLAACSSSNNAGVTKVPV